MIRFEDGSAINTSDWERMKSLISQSIKDGKKVTDIVSKDGVTVKVGGLAAKAGTKKAPHENYISAEFRGWTIRVWRNDKERIYGCNYFKDDDLNYLEFQYGSVIDENAIFAQVEDIIRGR